MRAHANWIGTVFLAFSAALAGIGYGEGEFNPFYIAAAVFLVAAVCFFFFGAPKDETKGSTTFDLKNVKNSKSAILNQRQTTSSEASVCVMCRSRGRSIIRKKRKKKADRPTQNRQEPTIHEGATGKGQAAIRLENSSDIKIYDSVGVGMPTFISAENVTGLDAQRNRHYPNGYPEDIPQPLNGDKDRPLPSTNQNSKETRSVSVGFPSSVRWRTCVDCGFKAFRFSERCKCGGALSD